MAVQNWNTDPDLNGTLEGVNVAEGSIPADFNDCFRKIAAAIRVFYNKAYQKDVNVTIQASGGATPGSPQENDLWIEYTP